MVSRMKIKIVALGILMMLVFGNAIGLVTASSEGSQPTWPTSWILADTDPNEGGPSDHSRDVHFAYYYYDADYLYFRLECFGAPNFTNNPDCRYKWFIDTDDPHNMAWQGSKVYEAEFLLFVEDSPNPGGDGIGEVYLLHDTDGDGSIGYDWHDYLITPGPIRDTCIAGYRIIGNCIDVYIRQTEIGNPTLPYFTWSTDQEDPNLDATSTTDRSDSYWNTDLSKTDVSIVMFDSVDPVHPGDSLTYTLQVTNHGPQDAVNVCLKDILPDGVTFYDAVPAQTDIVGHTLWWNFTSLAVGDSEQITINVVIHNDTNSGVITNSAVVSSDTYDPMSGDNEAWEETTVCLNTDGDGVGNNTGGDNNNGGSDGNETVNDTDDGTGNSTGGDNNGTGNNTGGNNNGGSGSYTPPDDNPATDGNTTPIENDSTGNTSLGMGNENNDTINSSYNPLSLPTIPGPSEVKVYPPNEPVYNAEPANVLFVLLALLLLFFLVLYYLRRKRKKDEEQEDKN
jgi:uncharacterized repeat protein (TIGR01451 family)